MLHPKFSDEYSDLIHKFVVVHTANVLHLFDTEQQGIFCKKLALLVKPGSVIWGRQVGLAPGHPPGFRQPEGKGYRFTVVEFRNWCLRIAGWDAESAEFEGQLVEYEDICVKRGDKRWVCNGKSAYPEPIISFREFVKLGVVYS